MGSFATKAPALIGAMLGIAATADGLSMNSTLFQCVVKLTFFQQVRTIRDILEGVDGVLMEC